MVLKYAPLILTLVGLVFELVSFGYTAKGKVFPFRSMKEKKLKVIEERGRVFDERIKSMERDWLISFGLLFTGIILQAIAVLILSLPV